MFIRLLDWWWAVCVINIYISTTTYGISAIHARNFFYMSIDFLRNEKKPPPLTSLASRKAYGLSQTVHRAHTKASTDTFNGCLIMGAHQWY
jgi:hypothetical protein